MKLVYLAHPYGSDEKNVEDAKALVKKLIEENPDTVFLCPLMATGFYYNDVPYLTGMEHCLEMLSRCDELWLCNGWEDSKGCCMEYAAFLHCGRGIRYQADGFKKAEGREEFTF